MECLTYAYGTARNTVARAVQSRETSEEAGGASRLNQRCGAYTFRRDFHYKSTRFRRRPRLCLPTSRRMTARSVLFWVAAACCVFAELAILRSLLFGRARDAAQQLAEQPAHVSRTTRSAEIAWALLPAVGLLFVLYLTWRAVDQPTAPPSAASRIGATIGD